MKYEETSSRGPAEIENPNKNDDNEEVRGDPLRDLPEWLEEFKDNLVDESVPETPRRFQFFPWITFGAASKSGIG